LENTNRIKFDVHLLSILEIHIEHNIETTSHTLKGTTEEINYIEVKTVGVNDLGKK
jgi:hypothetical protein